ncbi:hypothetical protein KAR91_46665 [Candidatus Pacearchaeota archaeon]|nr:hypothetical protein [Candidatus Pacearchaeota archaeon]
MIIQIQCSAAKTWSDRAYCETQDEAEKEVESLKKIYRFNQFKIMPGENLKIPGPIYSKKSDREIDEIVSGVDWLMTQKKDSQYPNKVMKVLQPKHHKKNKN